ncbi:HAD hydrolase-like protein [Candidatus Woesearchaeota archaeon]|nr:HAD hydrolase-like protein [Candidatus Woesearchaeota archaeon]
MKPILAFDLDGVILKSSVADSAYRSWFKVMGDLLDDDSVRNTPIMDDFFPEVYKVMERLTGLRQQDSFGKNVMTTYARNLYQMLYLIEIRKAGKAAFVSEMIDMIVDLKKDCRLALVTSSPEDMVLPALELAGIGKLFDFVYRSPLNKEPAKGEVMRRFVRDAGKPALYVGNMKEDAEAAKEHGVKFALAKWDKFEEEAGEGAAFNITSPNQLKGILGLL